MKKKIKMIVFAVHCALLWFLINAAFALVSYRLAVVLLIPQIVTLWGVYAYIEVYSPYRGDINPISYWNNAQVRGKRKSF